MNSASDAPIPPIVRAPLFFNRNRVFRIYKAGKLFRDFFGDTDCRDTDDGGNYPEEWIASSIRSRNEGPKNEKEGLSTVRGTETTLAALMRDFPLEMTHGKPFDVLVKALDSGIRLPAQVHPDKSFARTHFHSAHGKTEAWLMLATQPGASIYFGFKEGVTRADLERTSAKSEHDPDAFLEIMQEFPARVGDVWLIPGGAMHAIGDGCLLLEVQEPTDWVIAPEHWCGTHRLSEELMYFGLEPRTALECFDFSLAGKRALDVGKKSPLILEKGDAYTREALITYEDTPCFAMTRHTLRAGDCKLRGPAIFVVIDGAGFLNHSGERRELKRGDYFFLPYAAGEAAAETGTRLQIVECLASRPA